MKAQLSAFCCSGERRRQALMARITMKQGRRRLSSSRLIGRDSRESSSREVSLTVIRLIITGSSKARTQTTPLIWIALNEDPITPTKPRRAPQKRAKTWWKQWILDRRMWNVRDDFVSSLLTYNRYHSMKSHLRSISRWLISQLSKRLLQIFCRAARHLWKQQIVIRLQTVKRS